MARKRKLDLGKVIKGVEKAHRKKVLTCRILRDFVGADGKEWTLIELGLSDGSRIEVAA